MHPACHRSGITPSESSYQDLTTLADEALLQLIAHSNKQALLVLFDRHAASLYTYILPLVRGQIFKARNPADTAQAIVTELFTTLWDNRKTIRIATTVRKYLFSRAYSCALEVWRY